MNTKEQIYRLIQEELAQEINLDDETSLKIISKNIFEFWQSKGDFNYQEIKKEIKTLFYKTRSKLSILKPLMDDKEITEIMVNGCEEIFYEKNNTMFRYDLSFDSVEELEEVMHLIVGDINKEINELNPIVDARLPDGSRVNGVYKNVAVKGPTLTIRKFLDDYITMEQLISNGTISKDGVELLKFLVERGYNIFVSGGTSSGKTTLINALGGFIPKDERVIIIEDSAELRLNMIDNLVQLECRNNNSFGKGEVTMSALVKNSLRMRPDRIIVGEVRGEEVFHMLQAMNTGHTGMSTGHGNSIKGMLKRLETMYLMAASIDINAIRNQIAGAIDIMIHVEKIGKQRRIVEISEIVGYEEGQYTINGIMVLDDKGQLTFTGNSIINTKKMNEKGKTLIGLQEDKVDTDTKGSLFYGGSYRRYDGGMDFL